jgi:putative ABC transport system permease protein
MRFLLSLAWRDLRASGRHLWIFVACLVLGVSLVAAGGGLYRQVADALRADARLLFGGDVEVESAQPLAPEVLAWMQAPDQGAATVSRLVELRTMLRSADGRAQLIELQSTDAAYPLYGEVTLAPAGSLETTLALRGNTWGAALDATLAERMGIAVGDAVEVGDLSLTVRALITRQPDRSLRAGGRGCAGGHRPGAAAQPHRLPLPRAHRPTCKRLARRVHGGLSRA